jgi:hypothetical protein
MRTDDGLHLSFHEAALYDYSGMTLKVDTDNLKMVTDLPEHYQGQPAMQFIRDGAVDWDESHVLNGEVGRFVTIVRKERGVDNWFLGSITDETPREFEIPLDFFPEGKTYRAALYYDGPDADWETNPSALTITSKEVSRDSTLQLKLGSGGGAAVSLMGVD